MSVQPKPKDVIGIFAAISVGYAVPSLFRSHLAAEIRFTNYVLDAIALSFAVFFVRYCFLQHRRAKAELQLKLEKLK